MAAIQQPTAVTTVVQTVNGECTVKIELEININLNKDEISVKPKQGKEKEAEIDTWAIPDFDSETFQFGKIE